MRAQFILTAMQALLDQLPTLLGVLLGVAGAMASSTLTDRLRWRRDQAIRWDQRRLDAYVMFTAALKDATRISHRLTATHRLGAAAPTISRSAALAILDASEERNSKDWEHLLLLGDADTVAAARRWRSAVSLLVRLALNESWDRMQWEHAVHQVDHARDEFHAAARQSLGVRGGSVEQFTFLREAHGELPSQRTIDLPTADPTEAGPPQ